MPDTPQLDSPAFNEQLSDSELLDFCFESREDSRAFFEPIWEEAGYFWSVNASESFSETDKKHLKETQRPDIDPPFAAGVLEAVIGSEWAQLTEPVFHGVDKGYEDEVIADWLTQLLRNGFALTEADHVLMEAYQDMLVGGYGFVEWYIDLHRVPFRVVPKHLNFWQCWPDPDAVERNLRDANFFIFESYWRLEDAVANWPEKEKELKGAASGKASASSVSPRTPKTTGGKGGRTRRKDEVLVITFQYRRAVARAHYVDPESGEEVDSSKADYEIRKKAINDKAEADLSDFDRQLEAWNLMASSPEPMISQSAGPMPQQPQVLQIDSAWEAENVQIYNGHEYRRARICGESKDKGSILDDKEIDLPLPGNEPGFTVKAVTGYAWKQRKEERVRRFGLMRKIVHIQEWFTKAVQAYLELQSRKIKGGGFAEKGAFDGIEGGFQKFVKLSSTPGQWFETADGALAAGKIQPNMPVQGEPGILEIVNVMKEMFGWVTGVTQALQGTMSSDRSNVLTENLQQQGLQMLLPIRRPRQAFLLSCGRLFAAIALKHLPAEELDRILGVQEIPGMTVEQATDPQTDQPQVGPDGKPVFQPLLGKDGQPMTAGRILKEADLLEFDLEADISAADQTDKMRFMQVWQQHGLGQILADSLPGAKGTRIWLPRLFRNLPMPASDAKAMSAEAEKLLDEQAQAETQQGILSAFQQLAQGDPATAQQVFQQISQMAGQGQQQQGGGQPGGQESGPPGAGG